MMMIKLTKGVAIVDDDSFERFFGHTWHISNGYAAREIRVLGKRKMIFMHREVNMTEVGYVTDHINGNKLDNRRENLRTATKSQNAANFGKRKDGKSSKYRGVQRNTKSSTFMARIRKDGVVHYLGSFKTQEEAAIAYNDAALAFFGEYARVNIVRGHDEDNTIINSPNTSTDDGSAA